MPLDLALHLARSLGNPVLNLAILAEGNVSARVDDETFWVKASGHEMATIDETGFVAVNRPAILRVLNDELTDAEIRQILADARRDPNAGHPSVETFMHAQLLGLPGVECIGHTHPTAMLPVLCSDQAEREATQRYFPDEVVCCGPASAWVSYVDPGLPLARAIRASVDSYVHEWGSVPKTIWLQNHGLIALGRSAKEVMSATLMSVKAATVRFGPGLTALTSAQIERIHTRPDEHHRQALLWR